MANKTGKDPQDKPKNGTSKESKWVKQDKHCVCE